MAANVAQSGVAGQTTLYRGHKGPEATCDALRAAIAAGQAGAGFGPVRVQIKRRGYAICGQLLEASPSRDGGFDWVKVETLLGVDVTTSRNVRLCNFDGRCSCEVEAGAGRGADAQRPPASGAAPLGNTGGTTEAVL